MTLPTNTEIIKKMHALKASNETETEEIREWTFQQAEALQEAIQKYVEDAELKDDPDVYHTRLYRYHQTCGGMVGLVEALYERARYLAFKELTENSRTATTDNKAKLTAGDRELYARGQVSDIKGLVVTINSLASNLDHRLYGARSRKW